MKAPAYIAVPGKNCFALEDDYSFTIGALEIWIPAGFAWNGASIPQALWSELGGRFEPETMLPSLEHDFNYLCHCVDRDTADKHFHDHCRANGMSRLKAEAMYEALHAFGETHWATSEEDRKEIAEIRQMIGDRADKGKFLAFMKEG